MTNAKSVSLEDLGWKFYYDIDAKYPLATGEDISITPDETLTLYFRCRPEQEADGTFYGNSIIPDQKLPMFFFGLYTKEETYGDIYIGGNNTDLLSLNGRIESFSLWNRALEDASVLAYHTNTMKMIGDGVEYLYQDEADAINNGLYFYFTFDSNTTITSSFDNNLGSNKSRNLGIGSGKTTNSSILDRIDDYIRISSSQFFADFTMNIRFMIEELEDFILIDKFGTVKVAFDEVLMAFRVDVYPYIGMISTVYIDVPTIKVHRWYNFALKYEDGVLKVFFQDEIKKEHGLFFAIGGVSSLSLEHSNVQSVTHDATHTSSDYIWNNTVHNYHDQTQENVSHIIGDAGGKNFMDMMLGKNRDSMVSTIENSEMVSDRQLFENENSSNGYRVTYDSFSGGDATLISPVSLSYVEDDNDGIRLDVSRTGVSAGDMRGNVLWTNALLAGGYIRVDITFKPALVETEKVFPMLFTAPGIPISVKKENMDNDYRQFITADNFSLDKNIVNGYLSTYNYVGPDVESRVQFRLNTYFSHCRWKFFIIPKGGRVKMNGCGIKNEHAFCPDSGADWLFEEVYVPVSV